MITVKELSEGKIPPWIRRFVKQAGKNINTYQMIKEGDTVLLGISGGKDSLALALALSLRRKWLPVRYELTGLLINWVEHPIRQEGLEKLESFFSSLDIPFQVKDAHMFPDSFLGEFNCYLCSRNRRRILFEYADEKRLSKIALGHHLDDFVETSLINLCFRGDFSSMRPVQDFFKGKLQILRPLCTVRESVISKLERETDIPVVKTTCPNKESNIRSRLKPVISQLSHIDSLTREHIFSAHHFEKD